MKPVRRVCLFGGTFDPIHNAHVRIACEARERYDLERVLFVPAGKPPHKESDQVTLFEHRYRMVEAACSEYPGFEASRLEEPPRSSYSIDTVETLRHDLTTGDELFFLIGSDAFDEIETWKRWRDLSKLVAFIVAARPGKEYKIPQDTKVKRLDSLALEVSSSEIRELLASGEETSQLPAAVLEYIRNHGLYGWETNSAKR